MENNHENSWVAERLTVLDPAWTPNAARARASLDSRLKVRSRSWTWAAAATAGVCIAVVALPNSRATAQGLWERFVLNRVDIVRVDLSRLPLDTHITTNGLEQAVETIEAAGQKAGFVPNLPALAEAPSLTVLGAMQIEQTVRMPGEWAGAKLRTEMGPMVSAKYPDGASILQFRPIEFSVPSGFALDRFTEAAFRSIGVSWWESHALGQKFAAHPAWLIDIPMNQVANIVELRLANGPALLIEDIDSTGQVRKATIIRTTSDRIYAVSSENRQRSMTIIGTEWR